MLLTLILGAVVMADDPVRRSPWLWSTDERVSQRLNPAAIADRLRDHTDRRNSSELPISASTATSVFVIDGTRNPELFMPWELVERFLNMTNAGDPRGSRTRLLFEPALREFGWNSNSFWSQVDRLGTDYAGVRGEIAQIERDADSGTVMQRRQALAARDAAAPRLCFARAEALRRARAEFGVEAFDRFLYTVIAPKLVVYSDDPLDAAELRMIESGCR
jgi:hypothetical protein